MLQTRTSLLYGAFLTTLTIAVRAIGQCPDQWYPIFGVPPGTSGTARAATLWDPDGSGPLPPQPVIAGEFTTAGGASVNRIARWDGDMWLPFGSGASAGLSGTVYALTAWDPDGPGPQPEQLVAGGQFTMAGSTTVNRVARWDGVAWQALDQGFSGAGTPRVMALASWDPDGAGPQTPRLVAGGFFTSTPGGTTLNRVAIWDGAAWQPLGNGFASGETAALTVYDPDGAGALPPRLVAGGNWTMSGTTAVSRIAEWDGAAWQPLAAGFNDLITGLTTWDADGPGPQGEQIVASGAFTMSGTTAVQFIARWNGTAWQPLGLGVGSTCFCVGTWDPDGAGPQNPEVVAAGSFMWAGGNTIQRVARWNGSTWQGFGTGASGTVYGVTSWDPDGNGPLPPSPLIVGSVTTAGTRTVNNVASWQGSDWRQLGNGLNANVNALTTWDMDGAGPQQPQVVAAGGFTIASGKTVNRIARFDGTEWQPLGTGFNSTPYELTAWDPDGGGPLVDEIVAVGDFTTAGGVTVNRVARFNGTQWQAFGGGIGAHLEAVTVWDTDGSGGNPGAVVVGGNFTEAAGHPGNYVAIWNGSSWGPMSTGFIDQVFSLASFSPTGNPADTRVYAGGSFGLGGAPPYSLIAQWNGSAWESMEQGVDSYPYCMTVTDHPTPRLVVGGAFNLAINATTASRVAGWSGTEWIDLAYQPGLNAPVGSGVVYGLTTWDLDGPGPLPADVIAGGTFTQTVLGPLPALHCVARWDGNSWEPLGDGMNNDGLVNALTTWDPDGSGPQHAVLVAGGSFLGAGGLPGAYITAAGVCPTTDCPGDADGDGEVGQSDLALVLAAYNLCGGDPGFDASADLDDSGCVDQSDLALLLGNYNAPCP